MIYQRSRNNQGDPLQWTVSMFAGVYFPTDRCPVLRLHGAPLVDAIVSDFNVNCSVGLDDLLALVGVWMAQDGDGLYDSLYDISTPVDQVINLADFAVLATEWLSTPYDAPPPVYDISDFDENGTVDLTDLLTLTTAWLSQEGQPEYNAACDISVPADQKIDLADLAIFAGQWMQTL